MNKIRFGLLAATAMGLLSVGYAYAAGGNEAFVEQTGDANSVSLDQSSGENNTLGSSADAASQVGNKNTLTVTQSGDSNEIGLVGSGFDQVGSNNTAQIEQTSNGNSVGSILQDENTASGAYGKNFLKIEQGVGDGNKVNTVAQTTTVSGKNVAKLVMKGAGNTIDTVSQTNDANVQTDVNTVNVYIDGNSNGTAGSLSGYALGAGAISSEISQSGSNNEAKLTINGNDNQFGVTQENVNGGSNSLQALQLQGDRNELGVVQTTGDPNDANSLTINKIKGDDNNVGVSQTGWGNNVGTISLGETSNSSNGNLISLSQKDGADADIVVYAGDYNDVYVSQSGASTIRHNAKVSITSSAIGAGPNNEVIVLQGGNGLEAETTILGDLNYSRTYQASVANTASTYIDGDANYVNTVQKNSAQHNNLVVDVDGGRNTVNASQANGHTRYSDTKISIEGDSNEIVSLQSNSSYSTATVNVTGSFNDFDVKQIGNSAFSFPDNNSLTLTVTGDSNGDTGIFSGVASSVAGAASLSSGQLTQHGINNIASFTIDSNNSLVAMLQEGDDNNSTVDISGGDYNEVAIYQNGAGNTSIVTQSGSNNNVGISQ
ncbi:Curlin associated repeat-containing protein [Cohaesibacter marisflavi]|uniref:Curlin associated repeat-containing protein n=1 Tax=Cohaesibacter marisflavi TaxID=655353 RepID=A0A1I5I3U8_9HYPH|nr:hypothetical protein [Cohaesibacter marisflavi]SFO55235.1 Curlin associated repeat-containing protein [Cohaesibacter marisflavi]